VSPKRDPGITYFSIPGFSVPDPGIENSIQGLQSLVVISDCHIEMWWDL